MADRRPLTITDALLADGTTTSLRIVDGLVASRGVLPLPGDEVLDAAGRLLLPAMAEAHAHLDKAFLAETVPNPTGDLLGAIRAMEANRALITEAETEARAERAAQLIAANGATAIRTHADLTEANGLASGAAYMHFLTGTGVLDKDKVDGSYNGDPSLFIPGHRQRGDPRSLDQALSDLENERGAGCGWRPFRAPS